MSFSFRRANHRKGTDALNSIVCVERKEVETFLHVQTMLSALARNLPLTPSLTHHSQVDLALHPSGVDKIRTSPTGKSTVAFCDALATCPEL